MEGCKGAMRTHTSWECSWDNFRVSSTLPLRPVTLDKDTAGKSKFSNQKLLFRAEEENNNTWVKCIVRRKSLDLETEYPD
jgi:hypothetical protein